jgi:hypothetical protein
MTHRHIGHHFKILFPISTKTVMRCGACGNQVKIDNAQADAWFPKAPAGVPQQPVGR